MLCAATVLATASCDRDAPPRSGQAVSVSTTPSAPRVAPGTPARVCGVERWDVKTGTDPGALSIALEPRAGAGAGAGAATVAELRLLPAPGLLEAHSPRQAEERIVRQLADVRLVCVKYEREGDRDLHLVVEQRDDEVVEPSADHGCKLLHDPAPSLHTMIVEVPDPECLPSNHPWRERIARVRALVQSETHPEERARRVNRVVSLRGLAFFDILHGQLGVAPNGIELHPVLAMCFGAGCTLE
jgi:hypothetical protein